MRRRLLRASGRTIWLAFRDVSALGIFKKPRLVSAGGSKIRPDGPIPCPKYSDAKAHQLTCFVIDNAGVCYMASAAMEKICGGRALPSQAARIV